MAIIVLPIAMIIAIVGFIRASIRVTRGESRKFQDKAKAEYQKQRRANGWDDNTGPSEAEFVVEYKEKNSPSFLTSFGLIFLSIALLVSSCFIPSS